MDGEKYIQFNILQKNFSSDNLRFFQIYMQSKKSKTFFPNSSQSIPGTSVISPQQLAPELPEKYRKNIMSPRFSSSLSLSLPAFW